MTLTTTNQPQSPDTPREPLVNKVAKLVAVLALSLVMVEVVFRVYFAVFGSLQDKVMYIYTPQQIIERNPSFISLPFVGQGPSRLSPIHNDLGFRGDPITLQKPPGVYRIAVTGGSTTYGANLAPGQPWPEQLQRVLREDYGLDNVEVVNTASVAYTSWNSFTNFAFRVVELDPDLFIVYHATNDTKARLLDPACYTGETPIRGLYNGVWRTPELPPSAVVRFIGIGRGWIDNPLDLNTWMQPVYDHDPACAQLPLLSPEEALATNPPLYFERNLRNLIHVAEANDVTVMFSSWAYYPPYLDNPVWAQLFDEHNAVTRELAAAFDLPYFDLMANLPEDETLWFFDGEHQSPEGARLQAELYAAYLVESGLIDGAD